MFFSSNNLSLVIILFLSSNHGNPTHPQPTCTLPFLSLLLSNYIYGYMRTLFILLKLSWKAQDIVVAPGHTWLVVCWSFKSWQHLRSHQDGHRFVTSSPHGEFMGLPHWETRPPAPWPNYSIPSWRIYGAAQWETRPPAPWPNIPVTLPGYCVNQFITRLDSGKYQFDKSFVWLSWV